MPLRHKTWRRSRDQEQKNSPFFFDKTSEKQWLFPYWITKGKRKHTDLAKKLRRLNHFHFLVFLQFLRFQDKNIYSTLKNPGYKIILTIFLIILIFFVMFACGYTRTHYSKSQIFVQKFNFDNTPTFSRFFRVGSLPNSTQGFFDIIQNFFCRSIYAAPVDIES